MYWKDDYIIKHRISLGWYIAVPFTCYIPKLKEKVLVVENVEGDNIYPHTYLSVFDWTEQCVIPF